jgi:hypothetical protein
MKKTGAVVAKMWGEARGLLAILVVNILLAVILAVMALMALDSTQIVTVVGYDDMAGLSHDSAWYYVVSFAVLALMVGGVQGLITLKIYETKGRGVALTFAWMGMLVLLVGMSMLSSVAGGAN